MNVKQYERLEKSIDSEIDNCNQLILEKENEIDSTKNGVVGLIGWMILKITTIK